MSPISLVSLWGLPNTIGANESTTSSASKLMVELLDIIDLVDTGDVVLTEPVAFRGERGARYADSSASKSGPLVTVGSTGRLILL
ncbi:hypothetical protein ACJZ2D_002809 [Fusarium nematophilum]